MGLGEVSVLYDKGEPVEGRFEGKRLSAEQMQETLRLKTGLEVPLAVLPAWIQGRADSRWDSRGSPEEFKQLGWQIRRVMQTESGIPKRTELTKGELKIVVGVQRWQ
jgi:outer membrane biogenesis lipoprotein LolB